jgi:hypothetical protein
MKRLLLIVALTLVAAACTQPDLPTLLTWAQYGIDADCNFGAGALAANVCTFGTDAIAAAQAAVKKDPVTGVSAVKQILVDAERAQPQIAPYVDWLVTQLP